MRDDAARRTVHRIGAVVLFAGVCCAAGACSSGGHSSGSKAGTSRVATSAASPSPATVASFDACSLLADDEVGTLLGGPIPGQPSAADPQSPGCKWENPATHDVVSVQIGISGTAPNNTLPAPQPGFDTGVPGPDGMRFLGTGQIEFPAGNRSNVVQMVVGRLSADDANAAAVELARRIGPKVPS